MRTTLVALVAFALLLTGPAALAEEPEADPAPLVDETEAMPEEPEPEPAPLVDETAAEPEEPQAEPASLVDETAAVPGFATIDRFDDQTKAGAAIGYVLFDDVGFGGDLTGMRIDLYGQYMATGGYGGYVILPYNHITAGYGGSESSIGNIELGGLWAPATLGLPVVARIGLSLPTADEESPANVAAYARFTDFLAMFPDTTVLRASGSAMMRRGLAFFRVDLGLDLAISEPEGMDIDPIVRLNLGGGYDTGKAAVMGELVTIATTGDVDDGEDRFLHVLAVTGRYIGLGAFQPYLSIALPIDSDVRDLVDYVVLVGAEYFIPMKQ